MGSILIRMWHWTFVNFSIPTRIYQNPNQIATTYIHRVWFGHTNSERAFRLRFESIHSDSIKVSSLLFTNSLSLSLSLSASGIFDTCICVLVNSIDQRSDGVDFWQKASRVTTNSRSLVLSLCAPFCENNQRIDRHQPVRDDQLVKFFYSSSRNSEKDTAKKINKEITQYDDSNFVFVFHYSYANAIITVTTR